MNPPNENERIIALLQESNGYLKELLQLQKKEHREAIWGTVYHTLINLLPWIAIVIVGYFVWQSIMHYLDALNENINTLKSNFDSVFEFIKKLIPDFSSIGPKIKETWQNIQFWN